MKIALITILLVSGICTAYCQDFGVQAGVRLNTSGITYPGVGINRKAGFEGGLFYRHPAGMECFSLRAAILYFNQEFSLRDDMGDNAGISYHFTEDNLKLPLTIEWHACSGRLKPLVTAGLYSSYCLSGRIKDRESDNPLEYGKGSYRADYGLTMGLGVYLTSRVSLNTFYEYGFARRDLLLGDQVVSVRNRGCSINLSYIF